jgi:2'-5' RNA ligase
MTQEGTIRSMSHQAGQTAIVVTVPAAEPVVHRWRLMYDTSARLGVPAHVTILYPFLDVDLVDDAVLGQLREIFAREPAFVLAFRRCGRFPHVLYLEPEPADGLRRLTEAVVARWPEAPPYGGLYEEIVPHLTVAHGVHDDTLALIEQDVAGELPVRCLVAQGWLLAFDGVRWSARVRLPLGARTPVASE